MPGPLFVRTLTPNPSIVREDAPTSVQRGLQETPPQQRGIDKRRLSLVSTSHAPVVSAQRTLWNSFDEVLKEIRKPVEFQDRTRQIEPGTVVLTHFNDAYSIYREEGGDAARYTHMMHSVAFYAGGNVVNCCGGDVLEGYALGHYFAGSHIVDIMNQMGVHFAVPGNHEFDEDPSLSQAKFGDSNFDWLLSNLFLPHGQQISGTIRSKLMNINGIKVGFMGLVGDWRMDAKGAVHLDFGRVEKHAQRQVSLLKQQGAEAIVALTHNDIAFDRELARLVPDIDVILGGHDHIPVMEFNEENRTLILKSGVDWDHIGVVALRKVNGEIQIQYDLATIDSTIPRDPHIEVVAKRYQDEFDAVNGERRVRYLTESLSEIDTRGTDNRRRETSGGNLVADAFRMFAIDQLVNNPQPHHKMFAESGPISITGNDIIAITNGGGIRSDVVFPAGAVTVGMADDMLPFPNRVAILPLTGSAIRHALESGVERVENLDGRFPQVSGIQFEVDLSAPKGQRVKRISIHGEEINKDKIYLVVTNDYVAAGGNGYRAFLTGYEHAIKPRTFTQTMKDVLVWYLEQSQTVNPQVEGRIILLDGTEDQRVLRVS